MAGSSFSCQSAHQTLAWISAIIDFIRPYIFLANAQVVNFFKDHLWEAVDSEWIGCLKEESVENLLKIPSGVVQDHWPTRLKEFILNLQSLSFPCQQANLHMIFPHMHVSSLDNVLGQGMNQKKKHEVEVLSAILHSISRSVDSDTVIDVGAGQGYLSQVLSFKYQLKVVALDASPHHRSITHARAKRIKKHFIAQARKSGVGTCDIDGPETVTCRITCADALNGFGRHSLGMEGVENLKITSGHHSCGHGPQEHDTKSLSSLFKSSGSSSFIFTGLHACGDLSVMMLRSFLESEEAKAVISVGCCYNLLSPESSDDTTPAGFPISSNVKLFNLSLRKNSFDLACQSAERWRSMGTAAGLQNFELHIFRAAFQMVLYKHYPHILIKNPKIGVGRRGKALRQQQKRILNDINGHDDACESKSCNGRQSLFLHFCKSALCHLGLEPLGDVELVGVWREIEGYNEIVGAYWSLRAALGPVLETLILLDRLLFLQEEGGDCVEAIMVPVFDPVLSPRNVAIIAKKC